MPVVVTNGTAIQLFGRVPGGELWMWTGSSWCYVAEPVESMPDVVLNSAGRVELYFRGDLVAKRAVQQSGCTFTTESLGELLTAGPDVAVDSVGRLTVFARLANYSIGYRYQQANGSFGSWQYLGGDIRQLDSAATPADGSEGQSTDDVTVTEEAANEMH